MSASRQLVAALRSVAAPVRLPRATWGPVLLYLALSALVLGGVGALLVAHQGGLRMAALHYVFPDSWIPAAELLIDRFFSLQARTVLINGVLGLSLMLVTITLFWSKEMVSASFEKRADLVGEPMRELSLREQAWQEVKLFALFTAAQAVIFWIGYGPEGIRQPIADTLSYAVLFAIYAVDFLSPVMQRHQGRYSRILKTLVRHPVAAMSFGAVFALPPVIAGHLLVARTDWTWAEVTAALFAINIAGTTWAAISGTELGATLFDTFRRMRRSSLAVRGVATAVVVVTLAVNAYAFGAIGLSIHHKSQILKCDYDLDLSTLGFDAPDLGDVLRGRPEVGVHVDIDVHNPTDYDVEIEDNRVVLTHRGTEVGTTRLAPMRVAAGETARQRLDARIAVRVSTVLDKGRELLSTDGWGITLYLEVAPGFEFPIYLLE